MYHSNLLCRLIFYSKDIKFIIQGTTEPLHRNKGLPIGRKKFGFDKGIVQNIVPYAVKICIR